MLSEGVTMHAHQYDAIVIGGSYAGLSAALSLTRARKRVLVIDAGQRRNRFAHAAHGFLGQDGRAPADIAEHARAEVAAYPTASFLAGAAVAAAPSGDGFSVTMQDGTSLTAARLVLATGVEDALPDLPGLREGWGNWVFHCPYCHGYEVAGQRLGVLAFGPLASHLANLIPDWGPTTFFTNGVIELTDAERQTFERQGLVIESGVVSALIDGEGVRGVRLSDGRVVEVDALFTAVQTRLTGSLVEQLGCATDDTPLGPIVRVDMPGQTSVPGVFAAGDAAQLNKSLSGAVASGQLAGAMAHMSLLSSTH